MHRIATLIGDLVVPLLAATAMSVVGRGDHHPRGPHAAQPIRPTKKRHGGQRGWMSAIGSGATEVVQAETNRDRARMVRVSF